ncbi:hypothetical protein [uncultured Arthrobacter sp.]|uniref:hypothetical protein n=1 Tax=uncultured Arthrobacter sp. TaxID=114050 RepID=UPI0028D8C064|nr:hypothetical protein [uncultured Arthrobacter sp.]
MASNRNTRPTRRTTAQAVPAGISSWTRERKIYLAIGVLASLAGVLLIVLSL